jgi:glutathione transport system substrate-binding protein
MLLATACGSSSPTATGPAPATTGAQAPAAKVFTDAMAGDATTLDPGNTTDNLSYSIERTFYEGLLTFDQHMQIQPLLATKWEVSSDGLTYTFTLRQGVKFSDGTPFDAQAAKVNFDRLRDPNNHLQRYSLFSMIKDVKVVDDHTVQVVLDHPFSAFIYDVAHPAAMMISPKALQQYGNQGIATHPVGTGPFTFVEWVHGDHITVKKNPDYWQPGKPYVDQIVFKDVPDASQRLAMLKTGEAQFVYPVSPVDAKALAGNSAVKVSNDPSIYVTYVAMNELHKPFDDQRVRLALNYAVDKQALIDSLYQGYASLMHSEIAPQVWGYKDVGTYPFDLAKAKALLAQAGYPTGFSTTLWSANDSFTQQRDVFIQQQLAQVGVKVTIQAMETGTFLSSVMQPADQNKAQLVLLGWSPSTGDADWGLRSQLSKTTEPPNGYDVSFYSNPQVEQLLQAALQTTDPTQRANDYAQVQQLVFQDAPWIWLVSPNNISAMAANVSGAYVVPDNTLELQFVQIH